MRWIRCLNCRLWHIYSTMLGDDFSQPQVIADWSSFVCLCTFKGVVIFSYHIFPNSDNSANSLFIWPTDRSQLFARPLGRLGSRHSTLNVGATPPICGRIVYTLQNLVTMCTTHLIHIFNFLYVCAHPFLFHITYQCWMLKWKKNCKYFVDIFFKEWSFDELAFFCLLTCNELTRLTQSSHDIASSY